MFNSIISQLLDWSLQIKNQAQKYGNTETLVGGLFEQIIALIKSIADYISNIIFGFIRQPGVDTYALLLSTYPTPEKGWTVLVRHDETNGGVATLRQWNGTIWVNLETVVYEDDVATLNDIPPISYSRFKETITTADGYIQSDGTIVTTGEHYANYKYFEKDVPSGGGVYTAVGYDGGGAANLLLAKLDDNSYVVLLHGDYRTTVKYVSVPKNAVKLLGSALKTSVLELYQCRDMDSLLPFISDRSIASIFHSIFNNDVFLKESYKQTYNYTTNTFAYSENWRTTAIQRVHKGDPLIYTGYVPGGDYKGIVYFDKNLNPIAFDLGSLGTYTNYIATVPDNDDIYYCIAIARALEGDPRAFYLKKIQINYLPLVELLLNGSTDSFKIDMQTIAGLPDQPFFGSGRGYEIHRPRIASTPSRIYLIPNGSPTGVRSKFEMFSTDYSDDSLNYQALNILVYLNEIHIGGNRAGNHGNSKVIIGGKYMGSAIILGCARTEYQVTDQVDMYGTRHTIEKVLQLKPSFEPSSPQAGDIYFDSTMNKHRACDGTYWHDLY